ncbi:MAG: ferritin family protein [Bdellovibrio sp.]|nr:ferritin family protein [Bdellovibrio sp.]
MFQSESLNEIHDLDRKIEIICSDTTLGGTIVEIGGALSVGELFHALSSSKNSFLKMTPVCDLKFCNPQCQEQECAELTSEECIRKIFAAESALAQALPCTHYFIFAHNMHHAPDKNMMRGWAGVSYAYRRSFPPKVFLVHLECLIQKDQNHLKALALLGTNLIYSAIYCSGDRQDFISSISDSFSKNVLNIKEVIMPTNYNVDDLLKQAIFQEVQSQQFYKKALEKAKIPDVKNFLKQLIQEEEQHEKMIKNLMESEIYDGSLAIDGSFMKDLGISHKAESINWSDNLTMQEVLKVALTREYSAIQLFECFTALPLHSEIKMLFQNLVREEKRHHQDIEKRYHALSGDMGDDF